MPDETGFDQADWGREVAPGARLVSVIEEREERGREEREVPLPLQSGDRLVLVTARRGFVRLVIEYEVLGWRVRVSSAGQWLTAPGRAVPVHVEIKSPDDPHARTQRAITTEVLRAIPLQDARRRLRKIQRDEEAKLPPDDWHAWGDRLTTDYQWATFARTYAGVVESGERSPIMYIAAGAHISRHTVSARVRIAREKGLLTKPSKESLGQLTDKARRILAEVEGD
jgi:hypothetical protein